MNWSWTSPSATHAAAAAEQPAPVAPHGDPERAQRELDAERRPVDDHVGGTDADRGSGVGQDYGHACIVLASRHDARMRLQEDHTLGQSHLT
jgi:hypothetical protein